MFTAFSAFNTDTFNPELQEEIEKNTYQLALPKIKNFGRTTTTTTNNGNNDPSQQNQRRTNITVKSFVGKSLRSYTGCKQCKARKKKCSETKPTCASCLKRGVECVYSDVVLRRKPNPIYPKRKPQSRSQSLSPASDTSCASVNAIAPVTSVASGVGGGASTALANPASVEAHVHAVAPEFNISLPHDQIPDLIFSSLSSGESPDLNEEIYHEKISQDIDNLLKLHYEQIEDLTFKSIMEAVAAPSLSAAPHIRAEELYAMDESQIVQNVETRGDDDDLLAQMIKTLRIHDCDLNNDEFSKYFLANDEDTSQLKMILENFISRDLFSNRGLDDVDKFYAEAYVTLLCDSGLWSFTSDNEDSFAYLYLQRAQDGHDDALLQAIIAFGALWCTNVSSKKGLASMQNAVIEYGTNYAKFMAEEDKPGITNAHLAASISCVLTLLAQVGISQGDVKEWIQYHEMMKKFVLTHFKNLPNFVSFMKNYDPRLTKSITTTFFIQETSVLTSGKMSLSTAQMVQAMELSRLQSMNEFDSRFGYCTGIHIIVAQLREYVEQGNELNETKYFEFEQAILDEQPSSTMDQDGLSDREMEHHLTFFEVQQISARLYLQLLFKQLDPTAGAAGAIVTDESDSDNDNDDTTHDLVLNLLSNLQVLLKTNFEPCMPFAIAMCAIAVTELKERRILETIITHLRSHNQFGQILRSCMFAEIFWEESKLASKNNKNANNNPYDIYTKVLHKLDWNLCLYC